MSRGRGAGTRRGARLALAAAGWTLLAGGAALMVLPGPGIPLGLGGLVILGRDRPWARRLHGRLRERVGRIVRGLRPGVEPP